jgi:hypothetical protein
MRVDGAQLAGGGGGPHDPGMEARVAALEADMKDVNATLNRLEPKLDKVDDRVRALEIAVGKMDGKLDLLVAKMPSWWQQPVGVAAIVACLAAVVALGKAAGLLH